MKRSRLSRTHKVFDSGTRLVPIRMAYRKWQKVAPNIMTPNVVDVRYSPTKILELSEGRGIDNEPLYGVTLIDVIPTGAGTYKFETVKEQYSMSFQNELAARNYFELHADRLHLTP